MPPEPSLRGRELEGRILGIVTSCRGCPHRHYDSGGRYDCAGRFDGTSESLRPLPEGHTDKAPIPDWCPLEPVDTRAQSKAFRDGIEAGAKVADMMGSIMVDRRDGMLAHQNCEAALTHARQSQTADDIAAAIRALAGGGG